MRPPWRSAQKRWSEDHLQESSGPQKGEPRKHRGLDLVALSLTCFVSLFLASSFIHRMGVGALQSLGQQAMDSGPILGRVFGSLEGSRGSRSWDAGGCETGLGFDPTIAQWWGLCHFPPLHEKHRRLKTKTSFFFWGCSGPSVSQIPKSWHIAGSGHFVLLCWPVV